MNDNENLAVSFLHQLLANQQLNDLQESVFWLSWQGKTYQQIAEDLNYDSDYIRDVGFHLWRSISQQLAIKVTKKNIHSSLGNYITECLARNNTSIPGKPTASSQQFRDWGEVIDTKIFYGRDRELQNVAKWIIEDGCRLVGIFGIGGVGKTAFAAKLVREIAPEFQYLIWRNVGNAPVIESILVDIISFFSHYQETESDLPEDIDGKLRKLLESLRNYKCLIILDNLESILQSCSGTYDGREGCYRDGYDGYKQLIETLADTEHQSCLLVTGREIPISFLSRSGNEFATRYLQLTGLELTEGKKILQNQENLQGSPYEQEKLIKYYAGNPLALKIVSASIHDLFDGNLSEFWQNNISLFGDLNDLIQQQCDRLSYLEKKIIYWLALSRSSITFTELQQQISDSIAPDRLLTEIQSLKQRSLVEKTKLGFTLQPVLREFFAQKLVAEVHRDLTASNSYL